MLVAGTAGRPASRPRSDGWTTSEIRLGSPLPAVLPAVSRSASLFLTRSDPHRPPISPTNAGFPGFFVESRTGSKPGARRTSSSSSTCSTVHSARQSRRARYDHDPREPESDSGLADGMVHEADGRAELYLAWPAAPGCSSRPLPPTHPNARSTPRPGHVLARAGLCTPRPSRQRR